jgi:hypothetical protein
MIALAVIIGFAITACNNGVTPCTSHTYSNWTVTTNATCTEPAIETGTCSCGATTIRTSETYLALNHDWQYDAGANVPTCTTAGSGDRHCYRDGCDTTDVNDKYPALGHSFATTTPATCTEDSIPGICTRDNCTEVNPDPAEAVLAFGHDFDWEMAGIKICRHNNCYANPIIGDIGPAGGIIFHIDPTGFTVQSYLEGSKATAHLNFDGYTAYYLEAAPANMATTLYWACNYNDLIPGLSQDSSDQTDWAIGRGRMNTAIIIVRGITHTYTTPAASVL